MFVYHKTFDMSLLEYGVEVPIKDEKFQKFRQYIEQNLPHLLDTYQPEFVISDEILAYAHDSEFIQLVRENADQVAIAAYELVNEDGSYHRYNPQKQTRNFSELIKTAISQTSGAIKACQLALKKKFSYCLAGGHHHAMTFGGRGFCIINDIVMAAKYSQRFFNCEHVWVIDVDAHKGDGTAQITMNDTTISTYSIHMADGWPLDSGSDHDPWFIPSDMDVPVKSHEQAQYIDKLKISLNQFAEKFPHPDLAIVVQGSDPYEKDSLESASLLKLTAKEMLDRDLFVYEFLKQKNIPQAYVMSGGYGPFAHEPYINFIKAIKNDL